MAISKKELAYDKLESIILNRVMELEHENAQLRKDLAGANAKLSVYERLASISDSKITLGFGPPMREEDY